MSRLLVLSLKSSACACAYCIVSLRNSLALKISVCLLLIYFLKCLAYSTLPLAAKISLVASFRFSTKVLKVYYSLIPLTTSTPIRARYRFIEERFIEERYLVWSILT
jgi:hypothetical protein